MQERRGVGRTEVIVGVAVVAVLLLVTVPLWLSTSRKSARAEVPLLVNAIQTAELNAIAPSSSAADPSEASPEGPNRTGAIASAAPTAPTSSPSATSAPYSSDTSAPTRRRRKPTAPSSASSPRRSSVLRRTSSARPIVPTSKPSAPSAWKIAR